MTDCVALIVAAGRGERLGTDTPKQYLPLAGRTVLSHSAATFCRHPGIGAVRVMIHPDDRAIYDGAVEGLGLLPPSPGGATRQDSVRLGLESLAGEGFAKVLIHDAARPLVDEDVISKILAALVDHQGAIPGLPVTDSLKKADSGNLIEGTVPRDGLWRAQTPQGFIFDAILEAHCRANHEKTEEFTDDAAIAGFAGLDVTMVSGNEDNFKITTGDDLARAERLLAGTLEYRSGQGFDVHAFGPEGSGPVRLCGVDLPHDTGLSGHSDADVGLHAITDALLGAVAEGDIGTHFPPTDSEWQGVDSGIFLRHAAQLVADHGCIITHLDVTVICEAPKIAPHAAAMRSRIAKMLELSIDQVSIKATTTEGLGALGRGDGIAAQALATISCRK